MNNELKWQKFLEWPQLQTTYLVNFSTDQQKIAIEMEDKYSGQIWHTIFQTSQIEQLTTKAKNFKSYAAFTKMLKYALLRQNDSPLLEILSYRQMNNRFGKPGSQSKVIKPEQAAKRFLLMTYSNKFEKVQYPLPLKPQLQPTTERLKLTIERLSRELKLSHQDQTENQVLKQNSLLKYENQSLKNKLKNTNKLDNSVLLQPRIEQMQKQLQNKQSQIDQLQSKLLNSQKQKKQNAKILKQTENRVSQLQELIKQLENDQSYKVKADKKMAYYEQKIQQMIIEMEDLSANLNNTRQKEKKAELKVCALQKQLENMINKKKTVHKNPTYYRESSPDDRKSEKSLSVRSGRSNTSQKSLNKTRNVNRKSYNTIGQNSFINNNSKLKNYSKKVTPRKKSVVDSDTQSSRMRRMANGLSSPYRQSGAANNKNKKPINQRSRSRSKQRVTSPRPSQPMQSQLMTDGYQSDSSRDQKFDRIEGFFKNLQQKKGMKQNDKKKSSALKQGTNLQKRMQTLEQMIQKAAKSTKVKQ